MAEKKLSPMMKQYLLSKKEYPDALLFYRIGDFYEMFYDDAYKASKALDLVLTGKDCGTGEKAPMCGVPHHALDSYLQRLVSQGFKVAIAEQMEDPKFAKGIVRREITRIVTPGTLTAEGALEEGKNNFLMGIYYDGNSYGVSTVDISTGEFLTTSLKDRRELLEEIQSFMPSEIIHNHSFLLSGIDIAALKERFSLLLTERGEEDFEAEHAGRLLSKHFNSGIPGLGLEDKPLCLRSAGAVLSYIYETQRGRAGQIANIRYYENSQYMIVDASTRRNLELLETMREKKKKGTLLWVLDMTKTAMGKRFMRRALEQPLISIEEISQRQDAVEEFCSRFIDREELSEYLSGIYDMERLFGRISNGSASPRDLLAFRNSIRVLPHVISAISNFKASLLQAIAKDIDSLEDLEGLLSSAISEDPPLSPKDGGVIREGYNKEVDTLHLARLKGKEWLLNLEAEEKEKTGIKTLKIKYSRVFGYCFEVTNSFKKLVPERFIRKQTLTNGERYTTDRLKELEDNILSAEEKLKALEQTLYSELLNKLSCEIKRVQESAEGIARIDFLIALSKAAMDFHYVRPSLNNEGRISIQCGRHPVIERLLAEGEFIANDTILDEGEDSIAILTGPNMAGKSTYMRQVALIVLMASIGSFVPAKSADIAIPDRIFTRVGASDDLASGQSTFMVEMSEVANILRNATPRSLLVLDEIGRGTSTFDGLSIAWAVVEYISRFLHSKTLFATHYHELTELEGKVKGVKNYCIAVSKRNGIILFLRKILPGGADRSYGIDVARLAGVPEAVVKRAKEISEELSLADISLKQGESVGNILNGNINGNKNRIGNKDSYIDTFSGVGEAEYTRAAEPDTVYTTNNSKYMDEARRYLLSLDINHMTPLEAMNALYTLREKFKLDELS